MKVATISIFVAAFGVSSVGLSGSSGADEKLLHRAAAPSRTP
jgi:hypothetical protein